MWRTARREIIAAAVSAEVCKFLLGEKQQDMFIGISCTQFFRCRMSAARTQRGRYYGHIYIRRRGSNIQQMSLLFRGAVYSAVARGFNIQTYAHFACFRSVRSPVGSSISIQLASTAAISSNIRSASVPSSQSIASLQAQQCAADLPEDFRFRFDGANAASYP